MTTDQQTIEAARAAFEDIIEDAPLPPEWSSLGASIQPLRRSDRRPRRLVGVGAALGAAAVVIVAIGAAALFGGTTDSARTASTAGVVTTATAPVVTTTTSVPRESSDPIDITDGIAVAASSELPGFEAGRLVDGDLDRAWNDASLRGEGAEITITFSHPVAVAHLVVYPMRDEGRFVRNYRVQGYEVAVDGLAGPITGSLADTMEPQRIAVGATTKVLTLKVTSTYPAQPFDDMPPFDELAIAEIRVFGDPRLDESSTTNQAATTTSTLQANDG